MEGSEECQQFSKLLEHVKRISELQNSGAHQAVDRDVYLSQLQRRADGIRDILARIQRQRTAETASASPQPQIYQNLGALMGSGLRNGPALPPKQSGKLKRKRGRAFYLVRPNLRSRFGSNVRPTLGRPF